MTDAIKIVSNVFFIDRYQATEVSNVVLFDRYKVTVVSIVCSEMTDARLVAFIEQVFYV